MQKKLIALALASLAGSAFAQSNVTVYGVVDMGQAWVRSSGAAVDAAEQGTVGRLDNNSSYIGFKGVEDLGNGLKAVFQLETTYNADNGTGWGGARDTYIGLAGGFGTVVAGNLTHGLRAQGLKAELLPGAAGFGTMGSVTGTVAGLNVATGADARAANALAYISPNFSGFTGLVAYVNGENKTNTDVNQRAFQAVGSYENGPIYASLGYHKAYDFAGISNADATVWRAAGAYTFPTNTKVTALYDSTKVDEVDVKRTAWSLGVAQGFGKHTVGLEYARANKVKIGGDTVDDTNVSIVSALYTYELSKRTLAHVRYSKLSNDDNANINFMNNPVGNGVATGGAAGAGSNYTGFMVGLRHSF